MQEQAFQALFNHLRTFAKKEGYDFVKASPFIDETQQSEILFKRIGFRPAPLHVLAETTWLLDVSPDEETILMNMKKNHRNLIRRCKREGVRIEIHTDDEALNRFNDMHDEVVRRHNFHRFSRKYIEDEFHALVKHGEAAIFEAYLPDGRWMPVQSLCFLVPWPIIAIVHHLIWIRNYQLRISIQWAVIQEAKKHGCTDYNFWGIAPKDAGKDHPFYGITHFKKGFGGRQKDCLHLSGYATVPSLLD